jgi:ABC-type antimicrobial peptide transport system permease subunit
MNDRARKALANVPVLVNFIAFSTATVVGLIVALLALVAFQARQEEFALRLAIGQRRSRLLLGLALESGVLALAAWLVGVVVGWLVLYAYDALVFEPRGFLVRLLDVRPLLASASLPLISVLASVAALGLRLYRMDPVAILQRHE